MSDGPTIPDYARACVSNIVPALLTHRDIGRGWIPDDVLDAKQVVLLVIDGLGYEQLQDRREVCPTLMSMLQGPITTVAPTTTATALTSITTGSSPGDHGMVGYKIWVGGEVLNALRWSSPRGDAIDRIDPADVAPITPFLGTRPPVISHGQFAGSGFTRAHLRDTEYVPFWLPSSIPLEVETAARSGHRLVYAYYDGVDKIAHITGLGEHYEAELRFVDALVADTARRMPAGAALLVVADHGQVQVGDSVQTIAPEVLALSSHLSGEARFVWLHAAGGRGQDLLAAATHSHGDVAWVVSVEQTLDEGWFGADVGAAARARLGDVAMVCHEPVALVDGDKPGPKLQSRHGSLTSAEVLVPLLAAVV